MQPSYNISFVTLMHTNLVDGSSTSVSIPAGALGRGSQGWDPFWGEGQVGASVGVDGSKQIWAYQDGQALVDGQVFVQIQGTAYKLKVSSPPVAVLTGMQTASAGEAIVVAFRGRPTTRSFGLYTAGVPTGNAGFTLSDGALIALTAAVFADRTGQTYDDRIYPDELVDEDNYTRYFPIVGDFGRPIYVQKGAPLLEEIGDSPLKFEEIDDNKLAELCAHSKYVLRF